MAKRKVEMVAELRGHSIDLWCDATKEQIEAIEGAADVIEAGDCKGHFWIHVDPRYDAEEVREELLQLLSPSTWERFQAWLKPETKMVKCAERSSDPLEPYLVLRLAGTDIEVRAQVASPGPETSVSLHWEKREVEHE